MLEDEVQANNLVYNQLRDLIQIQQRVLATIRETMITKERELIPEEQYEEVVNDLENERLQHVKTQALLNQESENLQFALGEIDILTNQTQREKKSFEKVLASIKNKALKESTKNDKLKSKCNEMEYTVQKHEDILIKKENQINQLAKHKTTLKAYSCPSNLKNVNTTDELHLSYLLGLG
ncbi:spermatogenesis-associated protein 24-like isoform X1 [Acipenser oxyrinchus oxyrinchus]|uniref:Spermatogenesis-associated protein 24-like isoform X1 n=1 Tax=Acipenser oxyrinchus oxyrinchus TaxID=40147 RepID=A0AAD8D0N1_ACIOX|nr:spermatogenesis-associated protein 24-like isoform X1 [Acipenser oxyrinchus oxyrinchus]